MTKYLNKGAIISPCGNYRFRLWREWCLRGGVAPLIPTREENGHLLAVPAACVFIMLNPSTADGDQDDPTIRRCVGFAKRFGFDQLEVVNLFAWRATDPQQLLSVSPERDPVGSDNQRHVAEALSNAGMIVCAWGAHGGHIGQDEAMLGWIDLANGRDAPVVTLGLTKQGHPRHPLYLPLNSEPVPFNGRN